MRIAFLSDAYLMDPATGVSGTQVQMYNLAAALAQRGVEVHFVAVTSGEGKRGEADERVVLHWIVREGRLSIDGEVKVFQDVLDGIGPDVVYTRGRSHILYAAADWAQRKGKLSVWGSNGEDSCEFWKTVRRTITSPRPWWKKILRLPFSVKMDGLIHRGIRMAGTVVNQTEHQRQRLLANFGKEGAVLPSYFPRQGANKAPGRESLVLWLGNLSPAKQPEILLDLAEGCHEEGWLFVLAGWGKDTGLAGRIMARAERLHNVNAIGAVAFRETWWWLSRAAFLVNTSRTEGEGLPNTFVQAWLSGTPVLSLHHDPNGWIGEHRLGFCAGGDQQALEAECRRLMKDRDLIIPLGENARRFAERTFSANSTIGAYLEIFQGQGI